MSPSGALAWLILLLAAPVAAANITLDEALETLRARAWEALMTPGSIKERVTPQDLARLDSPEITTKDDVGTRGTRIKNFSAAIDNIAMLQFSPDPLSPAAKKTMLDSIDQQILTGKPERERSRPLARAMYLEKQTTPGMFYGATPEAAAAARLKAENLAKAVDVPGRLGLTKGAFGAPRMVDGFEGGSARADVKVVAGGARLTISQLNDAIRNESRYVPRYGAPPAPTPTLGDYNQQARLARAKVEGYDARETSRFDDRYKQDGFLGVAPVVEGSAEHYREMRSGDIRPGEKASLLGYAQHLSRRAAGVIGGVAAYVPTMITDVERDIRKSIALRMSGYASDEATNNADLGAVAAVGSMVPLGRGKKAAEEGAALIAAKAQAEVSARRWGELVAAAGERPTAEAVENFIAKNGIDPKGPMSKYLRDKAAAGLVGAERKTAETLAEEIARLRGERDGIRGQLGHSGNTDEQMKKLGDAYMQADQRISDRLAGAFQEARGELNFAKVTQEEAIEFLRKAGVGESSLEWKEFMRRYELPLTPPRPAVEQRAAQAARKPSRPQRDVPGELGKDSGFEAATREFYGHIGQSGYRTGDKIGTMYRHISEHELKYVLEQGGFVPKAFAEKGSREEGYQALGRILQDRRAGSPDANAMELVRRRVSNDSAEAKRFLYEYTQHPNPGDLRNVAGNGNATITIRVAPGREQRFIDVGAISSAELRTSERGFATMDPVGMSHLSIRDPRSGEWISLASEEGRGLAERLIREAGRR